MTKYKFKIMMKKKLPPSMVHWLAKLRQTVKGHIPVWAYRWLAKVLTISGDHIPVGLVDLGSLKRLTPISRLYGYDRGLPIDRYYIENFLEHHAADIRGRVLEIGDASYTLRFGNSKVTKSDVLHGKEGNPAATFVADLAEGHNLPSDAFDCLIITQTLQFIFDIQKAMKTMYRILKPNGIVLSTIPGITAILDEEWEENWYWSFTKNSAKKMFSEIFPPENIQVGTKGNVLAATAFLHGLATQELSQKQLDFTDNAYQMLITVRAVKPGNL